MVPTPTLDELIAYLGGLGEDALDRAENHKALGQMDMHDDAMETWFMLSAAQEELFRLRQLEK